MIRIIARASPLSQAQVEEVMQNLRLVHPHLSISVTWKQTTGDLDRITSLKTLDKTNFFTKELDEALLAQEADLAIHSAKDLPDPLPPGLCLAALTQGVDPSDSLVFKRLPPMSIGTSSTRREQLLRTLYPNSICVDIRGTIHERLERLEQDLDAVVIAEAAIIRLHLTHLPRISLPGKTTPGQGRLALITRETDETTKQLTSCLHFPPNQ